MPSGSVQFGKNGKCCANIRTDDLDLEHPKELLNLDVWHRRSTARSVEDIPYGRFSAAPRTFFGAEAIKRSNHSLPSRLFLDPYRIGDGNLWSENFTMNRYQKGGQLTGLAGRSNPHPHPNPSPNPDPNPDPSPSPSPNSSPNPNPDPNQVKEAALAMPEVDKWVGGKELKKFVYVPGRIVNIVVGK